MSLLPASLRRLGAAVLAVFLIAAPLAAQSTGSIVGRVFDAASKASLNAAEVAAGGQRTVTARDGSYELRGVPTGSQTVTVSYLGSPDETRTVTVVAGQRATLDIAMGGDVVRLEAFRVEGIVEGQARALNQQKAAQNITNIVSSDAFGQFPDANIADAVRRLPGISVEREAGQPESRYVTIRGMNADFNAVSVDGQRVTISNDSGTSRSVPLDVVSTKSAEAIEVTKAVRPDQDGDGIGGAINIRTRNAFDFNGRFASAEFAYGYSELLSNYANYPYDENYWKASVSYGDFLDDARTVGFAVTANYRTRPFATQQIGTSGWWDKDFSLDRVTNPLDGVAYFIPRGLILQEYFEDVENTGVTTALDWRPDADTKVRLNVSYSDRSVDRGRQRQFIDYRFGSSRLDTSPTAAVPIQTRGDTFTQFVTTNSSRLERQVRDFGETQQLLNVTLDAERRFGDLTARAYLGLNNGEFEGDPKDTIATFRWGDNLGEFRSSRNSYSIVGREANFPAFTTSRNRNAPAEFVFSSADRSTLGTTDDEIAVGGDLKWDRDVLGLPGHVMVGAKAKFRTREARVTDRFYSGLATGTYWHLGELRSPTNELLYGSVVADYRSNSAVDGRYDYGFFIDPIKVRQALDVLIARGLVNRTTDFAARSQVNSYDADEDVLAFYAQTQVEKDKWTVLAGVRAEFTDAEFRTFAADNVGGNFVNVRAVTGQNDYWDIMPGVHVRYDASSKLVLRGAFTTPIARPSYRQLNPTSLLVRSPDDALLPTLTEGDSTLKPVRSRNLDLTAEYYLGSLGLVSGGVFYKDMSNNIYRQRDTTTLADGTLVERRRFRNADGATVYGFELSYEQQLRMLPAPFDGLGVFANYTNTESEVEGLLARDPANPNAFIKRTQKTPLFAQVDDTLNGGLSYSKYGIDARLAYSWRSGYLLFNGVDINPKLDRYLSDYEQLDLTVSYRLTRNLTVFLEAVNLTNEPEKAYDGDESLRPDYAEYRDWSANLGIRWRL
jgi:TonB-dependent receptor